MFARKLLSRLACSALLLFGCDSGIDPGRLAPLSAVIIEPSNPRVEIESTLQLEATLVDAAGEPVDGRSVFWASENTSIAEVSSTGLVTGRGVGSTRIAASAEGVDAITTVTVVPLGVATVTVSPEHREVEVGGSATFQAVGTDRKGDPVGGRPVTWTTGNANVATVDGNGRVTGVSVGTTEVRASIDGKTGTATIGVVRASVASVVVAPQNAVLAVGRTQEFTATARDADGDPLTGRAVEWSSSNTDVATVSSTGLVEAKATGTAKIGATIEGRTDEANLTVVPVAVASVDVAPRSATLSVGGTRSFSATPRGERGEALSGRTVTWSTSSSSIVAVTSAGVATAVGPGTATITATVEGKSSEATVTVTTVPVATVSVSPSSAEIVVGSTRQFTADPRDAAGNPLQGRTVTWSSSNSSIVTVTGTGVATAVAPGTAKITATVEGKSSEATVTVTAVPVATVTISPTTAEMVVGSTRQFTADPRDADGNALQGRSVTWSSSSSSIVTVTSAGIATAVAPGTAKITATVEGKSSEATVTVTGVPVASVGVSPSSADMVVGSTRQFTAEPRDADGNALQGRSITWSSSNSAVVAVDENGVARALAPGGARITALVEGRSGSADITVSVVPVAEIEIEPSSAQIQLATSRQFSVTLKAADGTVLTGRTVTWSSDNPLVASVNSSGLVVGLLTGTAKITASSEGQSATADVEIVPAPTSGGSLIKVSGDNQSAENNERLSNPLVVRLLDAQDRPIVDAEVRWSTNNGSVSPGTVLTDSDGYAEAFWTLGGGGRSLVRLAWAEVDGLPRVEFSAHRK